MDARPADAGEGRRTSSAEGEVAISPEASSAKQVGILIKSNRIESQDPNSDQKSRLYVRHKLLPFLVAGDRRGLGLLPSLITAHINSHPINLRRDQVSPAPNRGSGGRLSRSKFLPRQIGSVAAKVWGKDRERLKLGWVSFIESTSQGSILPPTEVVTPTVSTVSAEACWTPLSWPATEGGRPEIRQLTGARRWECSAELLSLLMGLCCLSTVGTRHTCLRTGC